MSASTTISEEMRVDTSDVEAFLEPWLPRTPGTPHLTVTWAQSIDSRIASRRGLRTKLSGAYSHKMTHYLRSRHAAILVGRETVVADNPRLNCRYPGSQQSPVPVVLDSTFSWPAETGSWALLESAATGETRPPIVLVSTRCFPTSESLPEARKRAVEAVGGKVVLIDDTKSWPHVMSVLGDLGLASLMVEGGAQVLRTSLDAPLRKTVIVTLAPVFLGNEAVDAAPSGRLDLVEPRWWSNPNVPDSIVAGWLS